MAVITTGAPTFYLAGSQVSPPTVVGRHQGYNYVARYQLTVSSGVIADKIAVSFGAINHNSGSAGEPIRYKVTTTPTSHVNAGAGSDFDGALTFTPSGSRYNASLNGQVTINQSGTYYLYIFPGSTNDSTWSWPTAAVDVNLTKSVYQLTLNKAAHTSLEVKRGGVSLSDGASIAYGDVLNITFGADAGYEVSATLNGSPIQSGATHTVAGNVTVATIATASVYQLTLNKAAHTSLEVKRGGVSLSDGASIAYGDVLTITFGADAGYEVSATLIDDRYLPFINGVSIHSGATHTVAGNVTVATIATALGLVYIDNGSEFEAAQIFIDNGSEWEQHMPFIDNGTEFELYT